MGWCLAAAQETDSGRSGTVVGLVHKTTIGACLAAGDQHSGAGLLHDSDHGGLPERKRVVATSGGAERSTASRSSVGAFQPSLLADRVACCGYGGKVVDAVRGQVRSLWEYCRSRPFPRLIRAARPRTVRIADIHLQPGVDPPSQMRRHLHR